MARWLSAMLLVALVAAAQGAPTPAPAAPGADTAAAGDIDLASIPKVASSPAAAAPAKAPAAGAAAAAEPAAAAKAPAAAPAGAAKAAAPAPAAGGGVPTGVNPEDEAAIAAAAASIDTSTIPKVDTSGDVTVTGGSTAVGDSKNTGITGAKTAKTKAVPLDDFKPVWKGPRNDNQVLIDVVTDSPIKTIQTNQVPFIQSLGDALGVPVDKIYWYNITQSDLNVAYFLIDTDSPEAKAKVLGNLANPGNTGRFYENAAAYTLNILNGPEVPPQELQLSEDVISKPDNYKSYDGDTGLIKNNGTVASGARPAARGAAGGALAAALAALAAVAVAL